MLKELNEAVEAGEVSNHAEAALGGGDFDYTPPPEGLAMARFIGYVELGKRKQRPYKGKEKPDALETRLTFELFGAKYATEVGEGADKKTIYPTVSFTTQVKGGERSNFTKLLKKMTYGRDNIKHIAQMLGEAFLVTVTHNIVDKEGKKITYVNLRDDSGWSMQAPVRADAVTGEVETLPVPEATKPLQMLLWDKPTQQQWDSIFIDGTRTVKDAKGVETEVSKNWLQNSIIEEAVDFEGSALHVLIMASEGMVLDGGKSASEQPQDEQTQSEDPTHAEAKEAATDPLASVSGPSADPLADIGLG